MLPRVSASPSDAERNITVGFDELATYDASIKRTIAEDAAEDID